MPIKPEILFGAIGLLIGVFGLSWGVWKDIKLRIIQKRANAPHFVVRTLELDSTGTCKPSGKPTFYTYRDKASSLNGHLMEMEEFEEQIPKNYPDNRPIGVVLKNEGCPIRFFQSSCSEPHVFQEKMWNRDEYNFRFMLKKDQMGQSLRFNLRYETSNGFQGEQIWELERGTKNITRIKPPLY